METYYKPERDKLVRFDNPIEMYEFLKRIQIRPRCADDSDFNRGFNFEHARECLVKGDNSHLDKAEKLIQEMQRSDIFTTGIPMYQDSIVGDIPNIPAAIIGLPKSMYRRDRSENEMVNQPLRIFVETSFSAGVDHEPILKRGVAILAFAMAMQTFRPVELHTVSIWDINSCHEAIGYTCQISSTPIDLGRAAFMLSESAYARALSFTVIHNIAKRSAYSIFPWAWGQTPTATKRIEAMKDMLGLTGDDVFFPGGYLVDKEFNANPIDFVKRMIDAHKGDAEYQSGHDGTTH